MNRKAVALGTGFGLLFSVYAVTRAKNGYLADRIRQMEKGYDELLDLAIILADEDVPNPENAKTELVFLRTRREEGLI